METLALNSDMPSTSFKTLSTDIMMNCLSNTKADHEEPFYHDSTVIWFHDECLSMNIQRLMWIKLTQTFKCIQPFTVKERFIAYLNSEFIVKTLKFIISGDQADELCSLVKKKSGNYDVYELNIKLTQSIRKNSNTWFTFNNIDELFKTMSEDLKKSHVTIDKNKETSDDKEYTYETFLPPLGIFNLPSIPKSFHFLEKESSTFLLFQLLNKIIVQMQHTLDDLKIMWVFCRQKYQSNPSQMKKIAEFRRKYSASEAIHHYTEDSFLFRLLNEVLRREDTNGIYKLRCYIADLHEQLHSLSYEQKFLSFDYGFIVYRGKKLPLIVLQQLKELEKLTDVEDKLISMNGFLSTTKNESMAAIYAGTNGKRDGYESVVFKMHINISLGTKVPYADIAHISRFPPENEILFSMGSVWQLISIKRDDINAVWTIELKLSNSFDDKLDKLHKSLLPRQSPNDYYLFLLAKILYELGKYSQAGEFYHRLLEKKKLSNEFKGLIRFDLATMKGEQGEYTEAQRHLKKIIASNKPETIADNKTTSHSLRPIYANTKTPSKVTIWNSMGLLHQKKDEYGHARNSFQTALEQEGSLGEKAIVHNNLGTLEKFYGENMKIAHEHLKKAVELAENTVWSKKFKEDLESLECLLSENETHNQN